MNNGLQHPEAVPTVADLFQESLSDEITVAVSVPLGAPVDSALSTYFEEGFYREKPPIPVGLSQTGEAVYSVTLKQLPESVVAARGFKALVYLAFDHPEAIERLGKRLAEGGGATYSSILNDHQVRLEARGYEAQQDVLALADFMERRASSDANRRYVNALRAVAETVQG